MGRRVNRDELLEMFAATLTDEELRAYSLAGLVQQIAELRAAEPDDLAMSNGEIAVLLRR